MFLWTLSVTFSTRCIFELIRHVTRISLFSANLFCKFSICAVPVNVCLELMIGFVSLDDVCYECRLCQTCPRHAERLICTIVHQFVIILSRLLTSMRTRITIVNACWLSWNGQLQIILAWFILVWIYSMAYFIFLHTLIMWNMGQTVNRFLVYLGVVYDRFVPQGNADSIFEHMDVGVVASPWFWTISRPCDLVINTEVLV